MDEEKNEETTEETNEESTEKMNEESGDEREEETSDEIRDEDYANDDEIESDRAMEKKLERIEAMLVTIKDTLTLFVDSGAIIRENVNDETITPGDDFAEDFVGIEDLDLSV